MTVDFKSRLAFLIRKNIQRYPTAPSSHRRGRDPCSSMQINDRKSLCGGGCAIHLGTVAFCFAVFVYATSSGGRRPRRTLSFVFGFGPVYYDASLFEEMLMMEK